MHRVDVVIASPNGSKPIAARPAEKPAEPDTSSAPTNTDKRRRARGALNHPTRTSEPPQEGQPLPKENHGC